MSQQSVTRFTKVGIDLLARVGQLKKLKIVMEGKFFLKVVLMQLPLSASIPGASISWTGPCAMRWTGRRTLISQSLRDAGWSRMIIDLNSMSMIQWGKWRQSCAYAQSTLDKCTKEYNFCQRSSTRSGRRRWRSSPGQTFTDTWSRLASLQNWVKMYLPCNFPDHHLLPYFYSSRSSGPGPKGSKYMAGPKKACIFSYNIQYWS